MKLLCVADGSDSSFYSNHRLYVSIIHLFICLVMLDIRQALLLLKVLLRVNYISGFWRFNHII